MINASEEVSGFFYSHTSSCPSRSEAAVPNVLHGRRPRAEDIDRILVAHISTYPPRKCGIALYTKTLMESIGEDRFHHLVLAIDDGEPHCQYDQSVRLVINPNSSAEFIEAARFLNKSEASVVSLQHEYGIFGAEWGSHILDLTSSLEKPLITTFHTVLSKPPQLARQVLGELASASKYVVATLRRAARLLVDVYEVPEGKVRIIQHGAPAPTYRDPFVEKAQLGLSERRIALTLGFLSPAKGIEYSLRAVRTLLKDYPDLVYMVVGETHPSLKREEGEAYRTRLEDLTSDLGLSQSVRFIDRFVSEEELAMFLGIADVYIAPYRGRDQVSSGTLTRATASGKAIVATPTPFARESLIPRRGLLCKFDDAESIVRQVSRILSSPSLRRRLEVGAKQYGTRVGWRQAAEKYAKLFEKALEVQTVHRLPQI
jgi:glycosyltransferase involved in cell wall biosynthesis